MLSLQPHRKFPFVSKRKLHNQTNFKSWELRLHQIFTPLEIAQILLVNYFRKEEAIRMGKRTPVIEWMAFNIPLWTLRISESVNLLCGQIHLKDSLELAKSKKLLQVKDYLTSPVRDTLEVIKQGNLDLAQTIENFLFELAKQEQEEIPSHIDLRTTKGDKPRDVYIGPIMSHLIREYLDWKEMRGEPVGANDPFFFCPYSKNNHSGFYTPQGLRKAFKRAVKKSGISKNAHPHMSRHTYGAQMGRKDLKKTQKQLGHANIATTDIYTHLCDPQNSKFASSYEKVFYFGLEPLFLGEKK